MKSTTKKPTKKAAYRAEYLLSHLVEDIEQGKYASKPFPYMRELARETGVSLNVTRSVVETLTKKGYLCNVDGSYRLEVASKYRRGKTVMEAVFLMPSAGSVAAFEWSEAVQAACRKKGLHFRAVSYSNQHDRNLLASLRKGSDLIFLLAPSEPSPGLLSKMRSCRNNLVTLWHDYTDQGISMIESTPFEGMNVLLRHLQKKGNKVIHCVSTIKDDRAGHRRLQLWEEFLEANGMDGQLWSRFKKNESSDVSARKLVHENLTADRKKLPDAFICTNSSAAIGLSRGLYDLGLTPGKDVSLCAFAPSLSSGNNLTHCTPSITSLQSPRPEIIVGQLIDQFIAGEFVPGTVIGPKKLTVFEGESTA